MDRRRAMKTKTRPKKNGLGRNGGRWEPRCAWCGDRLIVGKELRATTTPGFSEYPELPPGTGVAVCGRRCRNRPDGAPVGRFKETK
jgi:hypothetical protein